jgi:hypothetical protein
MTKNYIQIKPDFIQTSENHADGSFTSGLIRRLETKIRQLKNGEKEVYSPWNELDPSLVTWLDMPTYEADEAKAKALSLFKSTRHDSLKSAELTVNKHIFDADEISIGRMASAILAATGEAKTFVIKWSLADTDTGVMTDITLADLRQAHKLAVINMASIWASK